jgi:hopanoid biosynthesis associated RND transporter like protein HpnN
MLQSLIVRLVAFCARHAWPVLVAAVLLSGFSAVYAVRHFAIETDVKALFPRDLPWTQRAYKYLAEFPDHGILAVVDAPTPELVAGAAAQLAAALAADHDHIRAVHDARDGPYFMRNEMLFLPHEAVAQVARRLAGAAPLIGGLAADPSLRGALGALGYGALGVSNGLYPLDALARPMTMAADTVDDALSGRPAHFSWKELASEQPADPGELRRFIQVDPVLDYNAVEPGRAATEAIARAVQQLNLAGDFQARVRLTGLVPMNDAQLAALKEHAGVNAAVTIIAVLLILWLALRSWQIIVAAALSLFCGLAMAAALGLFLVGALNPISVAFFVLFVGLGVDFGIQFAVRYRAERHEIGELRPALTSAARKAGAPLTLAAAATSLGFCAFLPTDYRGVSELGEIAGPGMVIAFLCSVTLLPAVLAILKPPPEPRPMGFAALAPVDRFLQRYRIPVVVGTLAAVLLASPLLLRLPFDFNPLHLQDPKAEAVATYLELRRDPQTGANAIDLTAASPGEAAALARRLGGLPEVSRATTLASFIPADQEKKLPLIREAAAKVAPSLSPAEAQAPPTDQQNVAAMLSTAGTLLQLAANHQGPGATAATRLSALLVQLAHADATARQRVEATIIGPLRGSLAGLSAALRPEPVTLASLPPDLTREWQAPDGRERVEVLPKGDPDDTAVLRRFVTAVTAIAPDATGPAVSLYEAGNTIVHAFIVAGVFAMAAIFVLLWITLRRLADVLLTLVPLLLAAVVTLELCVVFDLPLNFANVIALPLLLGVGVAFKIYYMMAWRRGLTALVQSTLSRAVIFSAMTTGTAFGSLWLSSHPGTSSMGKLMALALLCTMAAAVLFQPALMGPPRKKEAVAPLAAPEPAPAARATETAEPPVWRVERAGARRPLPAALAETTPEAETSLHDRES